MPCVSTFKHDNNVCACAVSALILLPVVNLLLEMDSATSISYTTWKTGNFCCPTLLFVYFGDFSLHMSNSSFNHITTSDLKFDVIFEFSAPVFL